MPLLGKYLCFAILALALDLVWGYCGILSLGHGAFFALGGYAMGMYLMRQIGSRGVYANPILPDFMVFLNWKELPWYWYGFDMFWFAAIMVMLVPGLLAFVFGWFAFRSRVTGVYLSIITQALTYALLLAFFRNDMGFGGNNGLTDFKDILGFNIQAQGTRAALFAATGADACRLPAHAAVDRGLAARQGHGRGARCRIPHPLHRLPRGAREALRLHPVGLMAGVAGALYVPQVGIINPGEFAPANSIEVVIWMAVGGRGTLVGPIIGALIVNAGKSYFTAAFPDAWLLVLGALFVCVTLFLPKGIVGTLSEWWAKRPRRRNAAKAPVASSGGGAMSKQGSTPLSRRHHGELRRLQGAQQPVADHRRGRDARHHRPQRRGQDHHDGRHHRQDPARRGRGAVRRRHRSADARRGRRSPGSASAASSSAHGVREPHGLGQHRAGAGRQPRRGGQPLPHACRPPETARIEEVLETVGLTAQARRLAAHLSHGQKQWLEIGMLLAQEPKLLLVDEPVAGMTDDETRQTARLLKRIAREKAVVVVEHDMSFVRELGVQGHRAARRLGAGRRLARCGERRSARDRSLSGAVSRRA